MCALEDGLISVCVIPKRFESNPGIHRQSGWGKQICCGIRRHLYGASQNGKTQNRGQWRGDDGCNTFDLEYGVINVCVIPNDEDRNIGIRRGKGGLNMFDLELRG